MIIILIPLICWVVGLLMYALAANPKVAHIGEMMFWVGLLVFLFSIRGAGLTVG